MKPLLTKIPLKDMQEFLTNPASRIVDSRIMEGFDSFSFIFQVLKTDNSILEVEVCPVFTTDEEGNVCITEWDQFRKDSLELFRLQYRNSPRMNPALYGLLDAADAESRVENTLPIQSR